MSKLPSHSTKKAVSRRKQCKAMADAIKAKAAPYWDEMPDEMKRIVRFAEMSFRFDMPSKHERMRQVGARDIAIYSERFPAWLAEREATRG